MNPEISNIINSVGKLLLDSHTTGSFARDIHGETINPTDHKAVFFCLIGAIKRCVKEKADAVSYQERQRKILVQNVIITIRDSVLRNKKTPESLTRIWEEADDSGRKEIAQKLLSANVVNWSPRGLKKKRTHGIITLDSKLYEKDTMDCKIV